MIKEYIFGWVKSILSWFAIHSLDICNFVMILNSCFLKYVGDNRGKKFIMRNWCIILDSIWMSH